MEKEYTISIPVAIKGDDEDSVKAAKKWMKQHFYKLETGASTETLHWEVKVGAAKIG